MSVLQVARASGEVAAAAPLIEYSWGGGLSSIRTANVCVRENGGVTVKYLKQEQKPVEYGFVLDTDEIAALTALVRTVKFFDQSAEAAAIATDVGISSLTVTVGKSRRALRFNSRQEFEPLTEALWRLVQQAIVTTELQEKGDTYQAMVASSPRLAGAKVYRPQLLVASLKRTVASCQERQKLEWGLTALAWLLTEDQWLGVVSSLLAGGDDDRKALLLGVLGSHPFYGNIPDTHARILLPALTAMLDTFAETQDRLPAKTDEALGIVCQFLGAEKYDRCVPILTKLRQVHGDSNAGRWAGWAIESINAYQRKPKP